MTRIIFGVILVLLFVVFGLVPLMIVGSEPNREGNQLAWVLVSSGLLLIPGSLLIYLGRQSRRKKLPSTNQAALEREREARQPGTKAYARAQLERMIAADQLTPRRYVDRGFEYQGTLDDVLVYLDQRGCRNWTLHSSSPRGFKTFEFMPTRHYAYCDVTQGTKYEHGDSYITFKYWEITRVSRTVYGCKAGVSDVID
jgi:hypothetical protein